MLLRRRCDRRLRAIGSAKALGPWSADVPVATHLGEERGTLQLSTRSFATQRGLASSDFRSMRAIAVDWSGRNGGATEFIWLAEVDNGQLVSLENGRNREQLIAHLIAATSSHP